MCDRWRRNVAAVADHGTRLLALMGDAAPTLGPLLLTHLTQAARAVRDPGLALRAATALGAAYARVDTGPVR